MRRIAKIVITVVLVISIAAFLFFTRERPFPDFTVSNVRGEVIINKETGNDFILSFTVKNNGTAMATKVFGTAEFEQSGNLARENCYLAQDVIGVNEEVADCQAIFRNYSTSPSEDFLITMMCAEGGPWKFNVTIQVTC